MLKNIKSSYFVKLLFSHINEEIKLKVIRYNKSLQSELEIKLINYKLFSGKYIIYEENNKGKEYYSFNDNIFFEGGYLNGQRNGKGKEYDCYNGYMIFEGEYLNGKKNGKGKEYDSVYNYIIFEGQYLNGKRNGRGKEFNNNGDLIFEGEYFKGTKWNGKGYYKNKLIYELNNGKGYIREYEGDRLIFEGEYINEKKMEREKNILIRLVT